MSVFVANFVHDTLDLIVIWQLGKSDPSILVHTS